MTKIYSPKKLIEVALPLDDINEAAVREKSIRHGHPSTLHLWWARRPLAAARAVIFAQMVNDPGYQQDEGFKYGVNKKDAEIKREKLFQIIRDLVKWKNTNNEEVLNRAREAIKESWRETCHLNRNHPQAAELFNPEKLPAFHDPFAGGGAIPLEAQRLGLESYASDLNPVAVMINKAMIEIPPKFADQKPIGPLVSDQKQSDLVEDWSGSRGLAEDLRRYGHWMREEAFNRIGHLYPKVKITKEMVAEREDLKPYVGKELTIIALLWARTVKSPSPAFTQVYVPLVKSLLITSKIGKEAWIEPIVKEGSYDFKVRLGSLPKDAIEGTINRGGAKCLLSGAAMGFDYIREQGKKGNIQTKLMALVVDGSKGRIYLSPTKEIEGQSSQITPSWVPSTETYGKSKVNIGLYGLSTWDKLYTNRQLVALNCFAELVSEVAPLIYDQSISAGLEENRAQDYTKSLSLLLGLAVSRSANTINALSLWSQSREQTVNLFSRQAIPMTWDFPEVNPFAGAAGDFGLTCNSMAKALSSSVPGGIGHVLQKDAQTQTITSNKVVSTDPPYYDNIAYADLADFFYVWLRRSLKQTNPEFFSTLATPKEEELVATPYRHNNKKDAETFFMEGMTLAMKNIESQSHPSFPITIYYAFKQSDTKNEGTKSTGWETFLEAVLESGLSIVGTWPMRTERPTGVKVSMNALASSIILVCRHRSLNAESISRRQFHRELREKMPEDLDAMIGGSEGASPIEPVDLAQAAIGPGMAIFSKYEVVLNQDGSKMSVHDALILINRAITEYLNPESGNFDADTLFCDEWFSQYGWSSAEFGVADTLARAKGTSVDGVREAGIIESGSGKVRLLKWSEYPQDWDPRTDNRTPVWEACHQMIRVLNQNGESEAGDLLARMPERGEHIRQLAYHLYTICERKKWADEARAYNELIGSWHAIVTASYDVGHTGSQMQMEII